MITTPHPGRVILSGGGPGAADLLSLRALRALQAADAILYDALLPEGFLAEAGVPTGDKRVHWLGEDQPHWGQARIHAWMADEARGGGTVARLKNGDPFVFGRGGEELEFLTQQNIPWEVVPGPSAVSSVLAEAGFSLTHRHEARSFAIVSARCAGGQLNLQLPRADSLVVYMGAAVLGEVGEELRRDGWPAETPAAIIERGCLPGARCLQTTLDNVSTEARKHGIQSPCLLLVGVAARRRWLSPAHVVHLMDAATHALAVG